MGSVSQSSPVEELASFLSTRPSVGDIAAFHLSDAALARVDELVERNKLGQLTTDEDRELDRLILLDDLIGLIQSHLPVDNTPESQSASALEAPERPEAPGV